MQSLIKRVLPVALALLANPVFATDGNEPPANAYLADSPWPMSHRTPYAQGSSPEQGPSSDRDLRLPDYKSTAYLNITLAMSPRYSDGTRVYWGSGVGEVYKLRANRLGLPRIDSIDKPSGLSIDAISGGISGAYTLVDRDNVFYTVDGQSILAYTDSKAGNWRSDIRLARMMTLPAEAVRGDASTDNIVGMTLLWDGRIAVATKLGSVVVMERDFSAIWHVKLGDSPAGEEISNSIAADENGGIYVVSAERMHRVQWTGSGLSLSEADGAWSAGYENGDGVILPGRLGPGSGSTPSLMGTAADDDRFVVITDAQPVAHLVLFWRDEIPADWQPIAPGKDLRIAAEVPVNFGDPYREETMSEQSVLVRGYGAVVVSNDYRNYHLLPDSTGDSFLDQIVGAVSVYFSGKIRHQPWGVHKFEWNPQSRTLDTAWVNMDTSCPNGIPTMSTQANMFYCIGARNDYWTVEGLDWDTGQNRFSQFLGLADKWNSFYAGTQIGDNGTIVSGTTLGVMEVDPR